MLAARFPRLPISISGNVHLTDQLAPWNQSANAKASDCEFNRFAVPEVLLECRAAVSAVAGIDCDTSATLNVVSAIFFPLSASQKNLLFPLPLLVAFNF